VVRIATLVLAGALTPLAAAPVWPAPPKPMALARQAGLAPETHEFLAFHVHAHLDVFVDGRAVVVPAGIGINIADPGVHQFHDSPDGSTGYGGIQRCGSPCISPLHTHDTTGVMHVESPDVRTFTLGQFFAVWGVRLTNRCLGGYCATGPSSVRVFVDGRRVTGDPRQLALAAHQEIVVTYGTPAQLPSPIPQSYDFPSGL